MNISAVDKNACNIINNQHSERVNIKDTKIQKPGWNKVNVQT